MKVLKHNNSTVEAKSIAWIMLHPGHALCIHYKQIWTKFGVSVQVCVLWVVSASPKCVFSLEGNIKNNILLSETKLKEESQGYANPPYSALSRKPDSHWLLAEDICMGTIGQVKGRFCDGCPLCKALCAQDGSFEWFLMMASGPQISSLFQIQRWEGQTCVLLVVCTCLRKSVCV